MATRRDPSGNGGVRRTLSYWLWRRWRGGDADSHGMEREKRGPQAVRQQSMERGHEPEESENVGGILGAVAISAVAVVVVVVALNFFFGLLTEGGPAPVPEAEITTADASVSDVPPPPRIQVDPAVDLQEMHQREDERLHTYGPVRGDSARLHIPISRAMQLIAERGLPADSASASGVADSLRVPTESGFRVVSRRFPGLPRAEPFLGSSPEPYTPAPAFRRRLTEEGYLPRLDTLR